MASDYVPDHLYARLFQPWTLPESEWPLCKEDWARVDAICALPWKGTILDYGCGDGTLAAMVASRNPRVELIGCVDEAIGVDYDDRAGWQERGWPLRFSNHIRMGRTKDGAFDGALVCEVLEHLTPEDGLALLKQVKAVCKPGALVCVTVPNKAGSRANYPGHVRKFSDIELDLFLQSAGFPMGFHSSIPKDGRPPTWFEAVFYA